MKQLHTFAVCAYKESPYLEECIRSLLFQTVSSNIIIATSTPNDYISSIAEKYDLPLIVNPGESGITQDWNFAYTFSDYYEIRENEKTYSNRLLRIKRLMLLPIRLPMAEQSRWIRRRILSFGSPICCPSVTFAKANLPYAVFQHGFRACEDWQAWEMISKLKGDFLYSPRALMGHRIHEGSETSAIIEDHGRTEEEYIMYRKFWPDKIARMLNRAYSTAQGSNHLE